jgi:hypothetical protein
MGNKFREVETITTSDELDERNNLKHQRVFDPELYAILKKQTDILEKIEFHLRLITEQELD